MPINPAVKPEQLNNPTQRASQLNDPQFEAQQGYYPYDLTHCEILSARFGEITPCLHLDTVPGDRHLLKTNSKLLFNRIPGNLLSTVNQYVDSFYVPLRAVFPTNYEKLIPNPVRGDDLPNSALPQFPLSQFISNYLNDDAITYTLSTEDDRVEFLMSEVMDSLRSYGPESVVTEVTLATFAIGRMTHLAYILSRGQLLDYLGFQPDAPADMEDIYSSRLQYEIDSYFDKLYLLVTRGLIYSVRGAELSLIDNEFRFDVDVSFPYEGRIDSKSRFRQSLADIFERGNFLWFGLLAPGAADEVSDFVSAYYKLLETINHVFNPQRIDTITTVDESPDPFALGSYINIGKFLAYQLVVAHYFTNDSIDNIFSSDLYMQNLRGCMFPAQGQYTREPVFNYNGVSTEYDYISFGSTYASLLDTNNMPGLAARQQVFMSLMFTLRRSLRYGDYFATARSRLLAVSDNLFIHLTTDEDGVTQGVSPIDVTKNLLMQRYLNAANYVGSKFLQFFASMYGVTPSDTGTFPRFLTHHKITLSNQITNNTAEKQGQQSTNIVAHNESIGFDVFIDDFGFLIQVTSFDTLPIYTSGIDSSLHFSDRFDYFNPMLQNIGDQPIRFSEMCGFPAYYRSTFGYTMRNGEYKYKLSKAHGAFVNGEQYMLIRYPVQDFTNYETTKISPEFIRDKAMYIDSIMPDDGPSTGTSPANYYHFAISFVNELHSARKIQATPPVLF